MASKLGMKLGLNGALLVALGTSVRLLLCERRRVDIELDEIGSILV